MLYSWKNDLFLKNAKKFWFYWRKKHKTSISAHKDSTLGEMNFHKWNSFLQGNRDFKKGKCIWQGKCIFTKENTIWSILVRKSLRKHLIIHIEIERKRMCKMRRIQSQAGGNADHWNVALQVICRTAGGSVQRHAALHSTLCVAPAEKLLGALGPDSNCCRRASSAAVGSQHCGAVQWFYCWSSSLWLIQVLLTCRIFASVLTCHKDRTLVKTLRKNSFKGRN